MVRKNPTPNSGENTYKSISFGTPVPSSWPKGLRYDVDYYGALENEEVVAHVLQHLALVQYYHQEGPVCMCLTVPWAMDCSTVGRMLKEIGLDNKGVEVVPVVVIEIEHDMKSYSYLLEESKL